MRRFRFQSLAVIVSVIALGLVAVPSSADVFERGTFEDTDSFEYSDCGYPIHVEGEYSGKYRIREGKNRADSAYFLLESFTSREVHTNTLTGESFVYRSNSIFNEVKATQVDGTVYEFTQLQAGQPFVIEDSSGQVVVRDRGAIRFTVRFDTLGDDEPGGEFVDFIGESVRGPHPGFFRDFCGFAGDLVGISDSSQRVTLHPAGTTDSPLGFGEYLPPDYDDAGQSPLLVFLHGAGESGDGSEEALFNLTFTAIPRYIVSDGWPDDRPFVVLAPQHNQDGDLSPYSVCDFVEFGGSCGLLIQHDLGHPTPGSVCFTPTEVHDFLTYAIDAYDVDPSRVYLTGLSCGAFGAWEYVADYGNEQIAAVVPIAGEGRPAWDTAGCDLGEVAFWAFHGEDDDVVNPNSTIEPMTNLQACPEPPRRDALLTIFPETGHDSWTSVYPVGADDDIYTWMLGFTN